MSRWLPALLLCLAASAGCGGPEVISPQPQPVPGAVLSVRADRIAFETAGGELLLHGAPGAVSPTQGREGALRVFDVAVPGRVAEAKVSADGSFEARIAASEGDLLRVEAELGGELGVPVDLRRAAGVTTVVESPRACVGLSALAALVFSGAAGEPTRVDVDVHPTCGASTPATVRLHVGRDFRFAAPAPTTIGPETAIAIEHLGAFPADDLLVIDTGDGAPELLSLHARRP